MKYKASERLSLNQPHPIQQEHTAVTDQREPQGSRRHGMRVARAERKIRKE